MIINQILESINPNKLEAIETPYLNGTYGQQLVCDCGIRPMVPLFRLKFELDLESMIHTITLVNAGVWIDPKSRLRYTVRAGECKHCHRLYYAILRQEMYTGTPVAIITITHKV